MLVEIIKDINYMDTKDQTKNYWAELNSFKVQANLNNFNLKLFKILISKVFINLNKKQRKYFIIFYQIAFVEIKITIILKSLL